VYAAYFNLALFTLIKSDLKILPAFKDRKYSVIEGETREKLLAFVVVKSINWRVEGGGRSEAN
jgi:hypothetical protein